MPVVEDGVVLGVVSRRRRLARCSSRDVVIADETADWRGRTRMAWWGWLLVGVLVVLGVVVVYDLTQRRHALLRTFGDRAFPVPVGGVGPELRQYIVVDNDAEKPFSRDQRRWIYSASKERNTYFGFGTDNDLEHSPGYRL